MSVLEVGHDKFLKITWSSAGVLIGFVAAGIFWLASVDSKATDAIQRLDRQKDTIKEMRTSVTDIDKRTIRIETILNEIKGKF